MRLGTAARSNRETVEVFRMGEGPDLGREDPCEGFIGVGVPDQPIAGERRRAVANCF